MTSPPDRPPLTGPQTISLFCVSGDGTSVTATLGYDADTGSPSSLAVANTSNRPTPVLLTIGGVEQTVVVKAGTHTYRGTTVTGWGLADVNTQLSCVSASSP